MTSGGHHGPIPGWRVFGAAIVAGATARGNRYVDSDYKDWQFLSQQGHGKGCDLLSHYQVEVEIGAIVVYAKC